METGTQFENRTEAGKALARTLGDRVYHAPVILALPRGGVPVALEVARALGAQMDLLMVRKIGVPGQPELAAAAVVNGESPQIVINEGIAAQARLSREEIERLAKVQLDEIARRKQLYLGGRTPVPIEGRDVIVVDDGVATGATMRASLKALRQRRPARLVLAVPVAAPEALADLRKHVDEAVCLLEPRPLFGVGAHYADFSQVSDQEVKRLMEEAAHLTERTNERTPWPNAPDRTRCRPRG